MTTQGLENSTGLPSTLAQTSGPGMNRTGGGERWSATENAELRRMRAALTVMRDHIAADITVIQAQVLLEIALGDMTPAGLEREMRIHSSTVSRSIDMLSERGRGDKPGYNLVRRGGDSKDLRVTTLRLTPKGRHRLREIIKSRRTGDS